jgi:hypothetical protein
MAVMGGVGVCGSINLACNINDVATTNCENCIALKNHLHNLTLELESANLIIKLLQEDANTPDDSKTDKSSDLKDYDIFNHKWITVANNRTRNSSKIMSSITRHITPIITTSNRFASLSNLNDPLTTKNSDVNRRQIASKKRAVPSKKKHKILILGDSHAKGLCEKISNSLDSSYSVMGVSKPNADLDAIISLSHFKTDNFSKNDVIIVYGGSRDISINETNKGLRCFKQLAMIISNTNVIILDAQHRHDLEELSCVNKEVTVFNRKLHKIMKPFQHVQLLNINANRNFFTRHGLHMNSCGKSWISGIIVKSISVLFLAKQDGPSINLTWPDESESSSKNMSVLQLPMICESSHIIEERSNINVNQVQPTPLVSNQRPVRRRNPTNTNDDFLWT